MGFITFAPKKSSTDGYSQIELTQITNMANHKIINPAEIWFEDKDGHTTNNLLVNLMALIKLQRIRLSYYDPTLRRWQTDFYLNKKDVHNFSFKNQLLEICINMIQENGFIPMFDGHGLWADSIHHKIKDIFPGVDYTAYSSGNSFHVYWHCLIPLNKYFEFFSDLILAATSSFVFENWIDLRWLAYNLRDKNGGLRITANCPSLKRNLQVPVLICENIKEEIIF